MRHFAEAWGPRSLKSSTGTGPTVPLHDLACRPWLVVGGCTQHLGADPDVTDYGSLVAAAHAMQTK